jgi:hypothetical protein
VLEAEAERYYAARASTGADPQAARRLRDAVAAVARARQGARLPGGGALPKPGLVKETS